MKTELHIAKRISIGGKNKIASIIAVTGVTCAVAVMLLTLAVVVGFKSEIREKLHGFNCDIAVLPTYSYTYGEQTNYMELDSTVQAITKETFKDKKGSLALRQPGILKTDNDYSMLVFTGYDSNHDFNFERNNIVDGELPDYSNPDTKNDIVISSITSKKLGLNVGDRVTACFFIDDKIKARKYTVAGIFTSNFGDFDKTVCYGSISALQQLCQLDSLGGTAYEFRGFNQEQIPDIAKNMQDKFLKAAEKAGKQDIYVVDNITRTGMIYLNWLDLLDTNVIVIFVLMCAVAGITLISSLFILILNSISTIGILRAVGSTKHSVRTVFLMVAMKLVGLGMIFGNVFALAIIWLQDTYHLMPLNAEMYYLSHVPVKIDWLGIVLINVGVAVFAWLTLVLPARFASTISPAKTMRYE
jgi:lipoprotein-releasing system permease protein